MSDSTQQYMLRKPVTAKETGGGCMQTCIPITYGFVMEREDFDEWFTPLDTPAIENQLDEIANKTAVRIAHDLQYEERTWDEDRAIVEGYVSNLISELKVLFGLENKETDNE